MVTDIIKIAKNLAQNIGDEIAHLGFLGKKILLVSDADIYDNCIAFFGENLSKICCEELILHKPKADDKNLQLVKEAALKCDVILAVGSGTIGDLCKLSSAQCNIPYVIFASAPSMNGYLSKNASILINGHKKSLPATLPLAVFCDVDILAAAPDKLIKAGIGDSLCFYSCWFDWYLSHCLLGTAFDENLFLAMKEDVDQLITQYDHFTLRDEALLALLMKILLKSGQMMTKAGGSYPASQSEHLVAHVLEMKYGEKMVNILHGQQIALTTLSCVKLQEELLQKDQVAVDYGDDVESKLVSYFGKDVARQCLQEFQKKTALVNDCANWLEYRENLSKIIVGESKLRKVFEHFGINISCQDFAISTADYHEAIAYAPFIRDRFTCLDLMLTQLRFDD